ncbi:Major facilitator super domain-containing protein 12 [Desmophyllum pertusum]|uniref:Major facilitator super domain-containing protein 12 n=1 Tax=Desmophyllum pertusum TaxID=174260 RepID=A0A9W9YJV3_9CNID|nr:Major facilitator super domain-containing protein 12 [Desmophyllum pertusum]
MGHVDPSWSKQRRNTFSECLETVHVSRFHCLWGLGRYSISFSTWEQKSLLAEALLEWQQERKQKKHGKRTCERKALLKVDCDPSPSGKRSSSQRVTTSVCDKSKTPSSCSDELTTSSIESTLEKKEIEDVAKEAIIDRSEPNGSQRTWKDWLKDPAFYKEAIAYFPLVVLISGVFASGTVKTLNKRLDYIFLGIYAGHERLLWFYVKIYKEGMFIYVTATIMGCGGSIMLVTSLSLIAELIGHDKKSGAFV